MLLFLTNLMALLENVIHVIEVLLHDCIMQWLIAVNNDNNSYNYENMK